MTAADEAQRGAADISRRPIVSAPHHIGATFANGIVAATLLFAGAAGSRAQEAIPIAVVDFEYADTSGEPRDQTIEHQKRLQAFMLALRNDLARSGKYRVVSPGCRVVPCAVDNANLSELLAASRAAGTRLFLFGGIHKMSTLVQWGKVLVIDVQADKVVFDRLVTFRGDSDEAWQRAEAFIVNDLTSGELGK